MKRNILVAIASAFLVCAPSLAQPENARYEVGFSVGAGGYSHYDDVAHTRAVLGLEACTFCNGQYALFGSYSRFLAPARASGYRSADLFNVGLRIQGRRWVSPFFDIGLAAGNSRFPGWRGGRSTTESINMAGAAFGTGVTFRTAKGLYVRPQFRLYIMSELYFAGSAELAVGWRF